MSHWQFRLLSTTLIGGLVFAIASGFGAAGDETAYRSKNGRYKVHFPKTPKLEEKQSRGGIRYYKAMVSEPNGIYLAMYADVTLPKKQTEQETQARLVAAQEGAARELGATVTKEKYVAKPFPSRNFEGTVTRPMQGEMRVRLIVVGNRLYQVEVVGTKNFVHSQAASKFLESFEVVD